MILERTMAAEQEAAPETRLWQAVILSAVEDWLSAGVRNKREAEVFLFEDQADFPLVCQSAGMDVDRLRSKLNRLRRQKVVRHAA